MKIDNRKLFWGIFFLFGGLGAAIVSNPPFPGQLFALGAIAIGAWKTAYSIEDKDTEPKKP